MNERIVNKPEVIAYLRYLYSAEALPDWVGRLKGVVDLREYLQSRGVELQAIEAEEAPMEEGAEGATDEGSSMDDVAEGCCW